MIGLFGGKLYAAEKHDAGTCCHACRPYAEHACSPDMSWNLQCLTLSPSHIRAIAVQEAGHAFGKAVYSRRMHGCQNTITSSEWRQLLHLE